MRNLIVYQMFTLCNPLHRNDSAECAHVLHTFGSKIFGCVWVGGGARGGGGRRFVAGCIYIIGLAGKKFMDKGGFQKAVLK
jgi:hypothetical protein